jgi:hypothetical protein
MTYQLHNGNTLFKSTYTGGGSGSPLYNSFSSDVSRNFFFVSCQKKHKFHFYMYLN